MRRTIPHALAPLALAAALLLSAFAATTSVVHAGPPLPYRAFGSGLDAGQVIEAYNGVALVGRTVADRRGNWIIDVWPAGARNGDRITFTLDGARTGAAITFRAGHFSPPPGVSLRPGRARPVAPARAVLPRGLFRR
jgi:hypothetical protein